MDDIDLSLTAALEAVVLVRRGRIPRTTSGKVRRVYLDGSLERLD